MYSGVFGFKSGKSGTGSNPLRNKNGAGNRIKSHRCARFVVPESQRSAGNMDNRPCEIHRNSSCKTAVTAGFFIRKSIVNLRRNPNFDVQTVSEARHFHGMLAFLPQKRKNNSVSPLECPSLRRPASKRLKIGYRWLMWCRRTCD